MKGKGNSINYKYRMHDPRIGRFFAVDPLASSYPWNSSYAFSENSTIAFVELEGLEKYFAADGSFLGSIGDNGDIRIVKQSRIDALGGNENYTRAIHNIDNGLKSGYEPSSQHYDYLNSAATLSVGEAMVQEDKRNGKGIELVGLVLDYIYDKEAGDLDKDISGGKIGITDLKLDQVRGEESEATKKVVGHLRRSGIGYKAVTIPEDKMIILNIPISVDYYDLSMTFFHERRHLLGLSKGGAFGEFDAHYQETKQEFYNKTTDLYKRQTMSSLESYLGKQAVYVSENPSDENAKNIYNENSTKFNELKNK